MMHDSCPLSQPLYNIRYSEGCQAKKGTKFVALPGGIEPPTYCLYKLCFRIIIIVAGAIGFEPTCVQLLFLRFRRPRRYTPMIVQCTKCDKAFSKTLSQIKRSKNHFCSRSCAASFNNVRYPKRKVALGFCKHCNKEISGRRTVCPDCDKTHVDWSDVTYGEVNALRKYQKNSC